MFRNGGFLFHLPDTDMKALSDRCHRRNETLRACGASFLYTNDSGTFDREKITFVDFYVSVCLTQCLSGAW